MNNKWKFSFIKGLPSWKLKLSDKTLTYDRGKGKMIIRKCKPFQIKWVKIFFENWSHRGIEKVRICCFLIFSYFPWEKIFLLKDLHLKIPELFKILTAKRWWTSKFGKLVNCKVFRIIFGLKILVFFSHSLKIIFIHKPGNFAFLFSCCQSWSVNLSVVVVVSVVFRSSVPLVESLKVSFAVFFFLLFFVCLNVNLGGGVWGNGNIDIHFLRFCAEIDSFSFVCLFLV